MELSIPSAIGVPIECISSPHTIASSIRPFTTVSSSQLKSTTTTIDKKRRLSNPPKPVVNFNGFKHFVRHVRNNSRILDEEVVPEEPTEAVPVTTVKKVVTVRSNSKIFSFTHSILVLYGVLLALALFTIISALIILD